MRSKSQVPKETPAIMYDESDFAVFMPYLDMLCGVAWRFTGDQYESERLVEQALLRAVEQRRAQSSHRPPKMALLSGLREAYLRSRETAKV